MTIERNPQKDALSLKERKTSIKTEKEETVKNMGGCHCQEMGRVSRRRFSLNFREGE